MSSVADLDGDYGKFNFTLFNFVFDILLNASWLSPLSICEA